MNRLVRVMATFGVATLTIAMGSTPLTAGAASASPAGGGTFSVGELEPPSFVPGQNEGAALDELNALFAQLTKFNAQGKLTYVQAQSVTSSDGAKVWTIKIKPGWTFQDGEPVTAQSYINAWNATAYGPNAWADSENLSDIAGYPALNPAKGKPTTKVLSGLKALNPTTIQVQLINADSQFPLELSTSAFLPLPNAYFSNPTAWESAPVGDGPYEVVGKWQPNRSLTVKRYLGYKGPTPHAEEIVFEIYTTTETAFTALQGGQVDITDIGQDDYGLAKDKMPSDVVAFNAPAIDYLGFPLYNNDFSNPLIREAISLAIDRPAINTALFGGLLTPATSILPPTEAGAPTGLCKYCSYNPTLARKMLAEAGGWKGGLVLWYPSSAGYGQEYQAIANELTQNLGIKPITFNASPFTPFLAALADKKVTNGIYRGHWGAYYPSMQNTLENLFEVGAPGYTETYYGTPEVTKLIDEGDGAATLPQSEAYYRQAEDLIMDAFPVVPLFYAKYVYVHSSAVSNVVIDVNQVELSDVTVNG
ncbi:MAG: ABC transporter substrate-binding protein [Acidimicrobiales bacterium]